MYNSLAQLEKISISTYNYKYNWVNFKLGKCLSLLPFEAYSIADGKNTQKHRLLVIISTWKERSPLFEYPLLKDTQVPRMDEIGLEDY